MHMWTTLIIDESLLQRAAGLEVLITRKTAPLCCYAIL